MHAWERQLDELREDTADIRRRAAALLTAAGVITGVVTVAIPLAAGFRSLFGLGSFFLGAGTIIVVTSVIGLLYCALAAAVLSIRAQEVGHWGQSELQPESGNSADWYAADYAGALYIIYTENVDRLSNYVGYLAQAQRYFRRLVYFLTVFVVLALVVIILAPSNTTKQAPPPSPQTSPSPTFSTSPSPSPSSKPIPVTPSLPAPSSPTP